jgi:hypothetical protein
VIGVNVRQLVDSPIVKDFAKDITSMAAELSAGNPLAGLNPLKDIDELILTTTGEGDKSPALGVVRGRFDAATLIPGGKEYKGVPIQDDPKQPSGTVALLDANTLIAGDPAQVRAAIDRRDRTTPLDPALAKRVQAMQSKYDIWGVGDLPKGIQASSAKDKVPAAFQAIDRFEFGLSLREGLDLTGQIHVRSAKEAEQMMQTMKFLEMMVRAQPHTSSKSKFDLHTGKDTLQLAIFIPEDELKKTIETQKANFAMSRKTETKPAPPLEPVIVKRENGDTMMVTLGRKN